MTLIILAILTCFCVTIESIKIEKDGVLVRDARTGWIKFDCSWSQL